MEQIYQRVTNLFAARISELFESEDTLKAKFLEILPALEFSRTDHWGSVIWKVFRDCWMEVGPEVKGEPTGYDRNVVLKKLHGHRLLDYNIFTQVLLNLQSYVGMGYQARDAEDDIKKLEGEWKDSKHSPLEPGAKMVRASHAAHLTTEDDKFNHDLSTLKSLKIIAGFTPQLSFRVSPRGQTPVFSDSNNISMLGIGSDNYLKVMPSLKAWYIHWVPGSAPMMVKHDSTRPEDLLADEIAYPFHSKSGGEILNQVLFSRKVAFEVFSEHDIVHETCIIIPRMSSVLVVSDEQGAAVRAAFWRMHKQFWMLELAEGKRYVENQ
jgi:hypothetical protein